MNKDTIAQFADRLNNAADISECTTISKEAFASGYDLNTSITVFVMAINRSLFFAQESKLGMDKFYSAIDEISRKTEDAFRTLAASVTETGNPDSTELREYLEKLIKYLFYSYNAHLCPSHPEYKGWDSWNREEDLRDYMMNLIRPNKFTELYKFTEKHGIVIPYMYALTFHIRDAINSKICWSDSQERNCEKDGSYLKALPSLLKSEITFLSRYSWLLDVMNLTENSNGIAIPDTGEKEIDGKLYIRCDPEVSFEMLLPNIMFTDSIIEYYSDRKRMLINPEEYAAIPLVPAKLPEKVRSKKTTAFLVALLKADTEKEQSREEAERSRDIAEEQRKVAEEAVKAKDKLLSDFSHTYGNMTAFTLDKVSTKLLTYDDESLKESARQVMMECAKKKELTTAVMLLRLKFTDNREKLREMVKSSLSTSSTLGVGFSELIKEAVCRIVMRILYDKTEDEKLYEGKDSLCRAFGVSNIESMYGKFEKEVMREGKSVIDWLRNEGVNLQLVIDDAFKTIRFKTGSYADFIIKDLIAECFYNMVKYGDLTKPAEILLSSDSDSLFITFRNTKSGVSENYFRGSGLESKRETLVMLNDETEHSFDITLDDGEEVFSTRISLDKHFWEVHK